MLDSDSEFDKPQMWPKCCPALGRTVNLNFLMSEYNSAKIFPAKLKNFKIDNLNLYAESQDVWLSDDIIKESMLKPFNIPDGAEVYIGLDLSANRDLTSISVLYHNQLTDIFYSKNYFLFANNPDKRIRKGSIDLQRWINDGYILQCERHTIDENLIIAIIKKLCENYNIRSVGADPWNSTILLQRIENEFNISVDKVIQNVKHLSFPLKYFEEKILNCQHIMEQSPVMRWNFRNVKLFEDSNSNKKIMKASGEAVDGAVALNIAYNQYIKENFNSELNNVNDYLINYGRTA
jgi:phage terminase large subunit-like protein